jgi:peptidoglycan hydrolase-like protein with peptidoglycan-binding domain
MNKKLFSTIGIIISLILITQVASAKAGPELNLQKCSLVVSPYNKEFISLYPKMNDNIDGNDEFTVAQMTGFTIDLSSFVDTDGQNLCQKNTTPFPKQYTEIPDSELAKYPLKPEAVEQNISVDFPTHIHTFYNNSEQDDDYYYHAYIKEFQIAIQADGIENTNITNLTCPYFTGQTGQIKQDFINCKNGAWDPDHFGGLQLVNIPHTDNNGITTRIIVWKFAVSNPTGMPSVAGLNTEVDSNNTSHVPTPLYDYDTGNLANRGFTLKVNFDNRNKDHGTKKIWTATTTSSALIMHMVFPKDHAAEFATYGSKSCSQGGWCVLNPAKDEDKPFFAHPINNIVNIKWDDPNLVPAKYLGKNYNFYWHDIGTVVTVWKAPTTPVTPPPTTRYCQDLVWNNTFSIYDPDSGKFGTSVTAGRDQYNLLPSEAANMTVKPVYAGAVGGTDRPLEYHWVTYSGANSKPHWINIYYIYTGTAPGTSLTTGFLPGSEIFKLALNTIGTITNNLPVAHAQGDSYTEMMNAMVNSQVSGSNAAAQASADAARDAALSAAQPSMEKARNEAIRLSFANMGGRFSNTYTTIVSSLYNPFSTANTATYFTGAPAGTTVGVQAYYADGQRVDGQGPMVSVPNNDGTTNDKQIAADCFLEFTIPTPPTEKKCQLLNMFIREFDTATEQVTKQNVQSADIEVGKTYLLVPDNVNSKFTDGSLLENFTMNVTNTTTGGPGSFTRVADLPATCPQTSTTGNRTSIIGNAGLNCSYLWTPKAGDQLHFEAVPNDGVATCLHDITVAAVPTTPICQELQLNVIENNASAPTFHGILRRTTDTESNADVVLFQTRLNELGYTEVGTVDGAFGVNTFSAVINFQKNNSLAVDGIVGQQTWSALFSNNAITKSGSITANSLENFIYTPGNSYTINVNKENSQLTDGSPIKNYTINILNETGTTGTLTELNPSAQCPDPASRTTTADTPNAAGSNVIYEIYFETAAPVNCSYVYTPKDGDAITVRAIPNDGVAACIHQRTITETPTVPICRELNLNVTDNNSSATASTLENFIYTPDHSYTIKVDQATSRQTDGKAVNNYLINIRNQSGKTGTLTEVSPSDQCPDPTERITTTPTPNAAGSNVIYEIYFQTAAPVNCSYVYTPKVGDSIVVKAVPDNGVAACLHQRTITEIPTPPELYCEDINLRVNGTLTASPVIEANETYRVSVNPLTNEGDSIPFVRWNVSGNATLLLETTSNTAYDALCADFTTISPEDGTVIVPSICQYLLVTGSDADRTGFSAQTVGYSDPDCAVESDVYNPPEEETPYCLYLDLDYNPEPYTDGSVTTNLTAVVVMSDGSHYQDDVRFSSTNGDGTFSGGINNNSSANPFDTKVDSTNSTGDSSRNPVIFRNGTPRSGINIYLANTNIESSAACARRLRPTTTTNPPGNECEVPPRITQNGNTFCDSKYGNDLAADEICWNVTGTTFTDGSTRDTGKCVTLEDTNGDFSLLAEDCRGSNICWDRITNEAPPEETPPPGLEKRVSKIATDGSKNYSRKVTLSTKGDLEEKLSYQITYNPNFEQIDGNDTYMQVTIKDPIFNQNGITGTKTNARTGAKTEGGIVTFDRNSEIIIKQGNNQFNNCSADHKPSEKCYILVIGDSLSIFGINSNELITIEYKGDLKSAITQPDCKEGNYCNEEFVNQSEVSQYQYCYENGTDKDGKPIYECKEVVSPNDIISNEALIDVNCQYFLTRASGDVFLEQQFEYGVDISKCYPYKNVTSTIVIPYIPKLGNLIKTGSGEEIQAFTITHELCSQGLSADQQQLYGPEVASQLSSQICEIGMVPGVAWSKDKVIASINQNVEKLTRFMTADASNIITTISAETDPVLYFKGIQGQNTQININQDLVVSKVHSIIVKDANLVINGNITYDTSIPSSLGVIVINGNIIVNKDVTELHGAYFVQGNSVENGTGTLRGEPSDKTLTIYGSVYGDIANLFENRVAAGNIETDGGAITIRYDKSIIENTPPGLTEIFSQVSQSQTAR